MKTTTIALVLSLAACGSSSSTDPLDGNWMYVNGAGTGGIGLTIKSDGTYAITLLALTSTTSGNAEVETGLYSESNGKIYFTPKEWSCSGSDPAYSDAYSFSGSDLIVTNTSGVTALQPNTAPASGSFSLTIGCFDASGTFTPQALAPVQ